MRRFWTVSLTCILVALAFSCTQLPALSQANEQQPAPPATIKPDTMLLKRTPILDGVIEGGEWDPFFQIRQGEFSATAYANWDEENLYVAVQGNRPTDAMITVDANSDGWFHGGDNYLLKIIHDDQANMSLSLERYDSRAKTTAPGATQSLDVSVIPFKRNDNQKSTVIELALPASVIDGLKPGGSRSVGLAISLRPAVEGSLWTPMATLGDVQSCTMSDRKAAAMDQVVISMALQDSRIVCGQTLTAKVSIKNKSAQFVPLESLVIGGDGRAGRFMNSQRVRLEGLEPGKTYGHRFETKIPSDMPVGSWAIGAEALSGLAEVGRVGAVLASFEVVEPFVFEMDLGQNPMVIGLDKERTVKLKIINQTPRTVTGDAVITPPDGWRLSPNFARRRFVAEGQDRVTELRFKIAPPAGSVAGDFTIKADVSLDGQKYTMGKNLTLITTGPKQSSTNRAAPLR